MRFSQSVVVAALAAPFAALASQNPFTFPVSGSTVTAGVPVTLTWDPTTSSVLSLYLRNGVTSYVIIGSPIAVNITNSGSYSWTPPTSLATGSTYLIEIDNVDDTSLNSLSATFTIDNPLNGTSTSIASTISYSNSTMTSSGTATPMTLSSTVTSYLSTTTSAASVPSSASSPSASSTGAADRLSVAGIFGVVALGALAI